MAPVRNDAQDAPSKTITHKEFEEILYKVFGLEIFDISGQKIIDYKFGHDLDSLSSYYDFTKGFNDQYPLFFTKELPDINNNRFSALIDKPDSLKKSVYTFISANKNWKEAYARTVAFYLLSKGMAVKGYDYQKKHYTYDDFFSTASKFFYIYDYENDKLKGKVCGGVNPFNKENISVDRFLEGFAFLAVINVVLKDKYYFTEFNTLINDLNETVKAEKFTKEGSISYAKHYSFDHFYRNEKLQMALKEQYQAYQKTLPFDVN